MREFQRDSCIKPIQCTCQAGIDVNVNHVEPASEFGSHCILYPVTWSLGICQLSPHEIDVRRVEVDQSGIINKEKKTRS